MNADVQKIVEAGRLPVNEEAVPDILSELAALSVDEYELKRKETADKLGWRVGTLDKQVEQARAQNGTSFKHTNGTALTFPEILPAAHPVDGGALLDSIVSLVRRYAVFSDSACLATALWIIRSFAHNVFTCNPLLLINSAEMQSGKTTLLRILSFLVLRPLFSANCTPPVIFRVIEKVWPTMLIDEFDSFQEVHEELRGIINSSHTKDSGVIRCEGDDHEPRLFKTCTPIILAMIGKPASTILDRSIVITMKRKTKTERVQRFPRKRVKLEAFQSECLMIQSQIRRWVDDNQAELQGHDPSPLDNLSDRAQDNMDPLLSIADVIGGEWAQKAREAAMELSGARRDDETIGVQLLRDIRGIFDLVGLKRFFSKELCEELENLEERPWATWRKGKPMSTNQLASQLRRFGITSKSIWKENESAKGYELDDFTDAWERYCSHCPENPDSERQDVNTCMDKGQTPDFQNVREGSPDVSENGTFANTDAGSDALTFQNPESQREGGSMEAVEPDLFEEVLDLDS